MGLPALKFLEGRQVRVRIIERYDEAECDLVVLLMIEEPASPCLVQRPALRMNDPACLIFLGRNLPQLLDTQAINLWSRLVAKLEDADKLLSQATPCPFREES